MHHRLAALVASVAVLMCIATNAWSLPRNTLCVWDPVGNNGPVVGFYSDLKAKALSWGIDLEFVVYTDERVASNDFKAGMCDAVHFSAILSRQFVQFAGSLDAIGGILSQRGLDQVLITVANNPKVKPFLSEGQYEMVASFPVGSMYAFVNDKSIDSVDDFNGKKISVLNGDAQAMKLALIAGASPVGTSLATFAGQFNNGNIDIVLMPALAYNTFELYHGLGASGGIIDHKLYYGMLQTIINKARFPDDFGDRMRNYVVTRLADIHRLVRDAEREIPEYYWIETDEQTRQALDHLSKEIRLALKSEDVLHPKALQLLWAVRCQEKPSLSECANVE